jgi:hypothetical protein
MKTVKIKVSDLLKHLKTNRAIHAKDYEEAMLGYRKAILDELKAKQIVACQNLDISHHLNTIRPKSFEKDYDSIIAMLEWTTDKEVELDPVQFKQYVQDEWNWKQEFATSTAIYKG